jgi:acyl carrier protein
MKASAEQIFEIIRDSNVTSTNPDELVAHLPLDEQGVDSLDRAMVFLNIQEAFDVTFAKGDYSRLRSVDEIAAFLNET